ncbi:MAG: alpha/beta hydrolase, partial [Planctomycetota bacterium]|nr:alpha/beta hydrolase [Planctomycetota bacterium]
QLLVDRPESVGGRNVILFGNADTNRAWPLLVDDAVHVDRGGVGIGDRRVEGGDLAVLMVRPHPRDPGTSVGIVTGTGMTGNRLAGVQPYWVSGIGYPDLTVLGAEMLRGDGDGVRAAGFFGNDWSIREGELVIPGPEAER